MMRFGYRRRQAVSTVVAELLFLAIVVALATSVFVWGLGSFGSFTGSFGVLMSNQGEALKENYVVEYVQFVSGNSVKVTVRDVGPNEAYIDGITIGNLTSTAGTTFAVFGFSSMTITQGNTGGNCAAGGGNTYYIVNVGLSCTIQVSSFTWQSGTAYNIIVSSARGNRITLYWKA